MLLSELLESLSLVELSQLAVSGESTRAIPIDMYPIVITHINSALSQLYSKFPLKHRQVIIQQYAHIANYVLHDRYARSNTTSTETYKYIMDSEFDIFTNDVISVDRVFNENGDEVSLNNADDYYSVFTRVYNVIQTPYPEDENAWTVIYRASPTKIDVNIEDPSTVEVEFPPHMLEALSAYVAHKALSTINPDASSTAIGKFLRLCEDMDKYGLYNRDFNTNLKLWRNGWV